MKKCVFLFVLFLFLGAANAAFSSEFCQREYRHRMERIHSETGERMRGLDERIRRLSFELERTPPYAHERRRELRQEMREARRARYEIREHAARKREHAERELRECEMREGGGHHHRY